MQEEARRDKDPARRFSLLLDCDKCMEHTDQYDRQMMACGFEPPLPDACGWDHPARIPHAWEKDVAPMCPGYSCSLPEVLETSYAVSFKKDGELTQFLEGEYASPNLRHAITVLESETSKMHEWSAKNPDKADP